MLKSHHFFVYAVLVLFLPDLLSNMDYLSFNLFYLSLHAGLVEEGQGASVGSLDYSCFDVFVVKGHGVEKRLIDVMAKGSDAFFKC